MTTSCHKNKVIKYNEQDLDIDKNTRSGISPSEWRGVEALDS